MPIQEYHLDRILAELELSQDEVCSFEVHFLIVRPVNPREDYLRFHGTELCHSEPKSRTHRCINSEEAEQYTVKCSCTKNH